MPGKDDKYIFGRQNYKLTSDLGKKKETCITLEGAASKSGSSHTYQHSYNTDKI